MPTTDAGTRSLQDRVIKILTTPKTEWPVIEAETTDVAKLYAGYIAILAAIPAVSTFIGYTVVGVPFFGRYSVGYALSAAVMTYIVSLLSVYLSAFIIDKLAPSFQSTPSFIQALKLVAYASTAAWVAGVFNLIPFLAWVVLFGGLYSIYLFYLGLPMLMKTPEDKVIVYMIVSAVVVIVVSIVLGVIGAALAGTGALMRM